MKHKQREAELIDSLENERAEKDAIIKELNQQKDTIRKEADEQINNLQADLKTSDY